MKYPIVVLHGWGLSAKKFSPLIAALRKKGFRVFAPDFPGFDANHIPKSPLTLADYVDFLHAYLLKYQVKQPILIGHSFGGRVALKYQQSHSVTALILTGTPGFTSMAKRKLLLFITIAKIGKHFFGENVRKWYYYVVGARDYYRAEGVMRETFKNIVQEELVTAMRAVVVPTLLVWGERDIITPISVGNRMKNVIRSAQLISLPGEDHGVPFKKPKLFVSAIYDFLLTLT